MQNLQIIGATALLPDRLARTSVLVEGGHVAALDAASDAPSIDASGLILAPALVDIHGDAFERQLMPRPGVVFPLDAALFETDRQLAGNGIATAFHALTLSWEPGLRSLDMAASVIRGLARLAPRLAAENRVQLRWETFCPEALPLIAEAIAGPLTPSIAFNDHTSMAALHPDTPLQVRPFEQDPTFPVADLTSPGFAAKMADRAKRAGLSIPDYVALFQARWDRRADVPATIAQVAAMGREAGLAMLSHDDSQPQTRAHFRALGAKISEFPMNRATALAARDAGDWIVFGAPNAARGTSHLGSPGAGEMIRAGLCDILASDYVYPAMLAAMARLRAEGLALETLWPLIAANPARASGLTDRGTITQGARADLVLLDWPEGETPRPVMTLRAGRIVHLASSDLLPQR
ncbi:alpha-D-ribose 1-methylphosphonate 5-triphosphate diphosphatase [Rhodobacter sp. KR11]|uniref:alpha-D-ribose 1-methylphosphonate 5-triphosphate diphosphatase n=1 Tax=Rhodobacter sp. KR11 TaxID=2974588 RepID=UPI002221B27D|nr:alpha-D-ribose 1-methylphosphonate 5-triphosphate diphosphatase [Rhodobacter sp. KR11]MCW1919870.1 alpha-D-ribose 1-methylphosphonate 5-triphosphate diphosphatase [Rhodobacter sp. KR11]